MHALISSDTFINRKGCIQFTSTRIKTTALNHFLTNVIAPWLFFHVTITVRNRACVFIDMSWVEIISLSIQEFALHILYLRWNRVYYPWFKQWFKNQRWLHFELNTGSKPGQRESSERYIKTQFMKELASPILCLRWYWVYCRWFKQCFRIQRWLHVESVVTFFIGRFP